MALLTQAVEFRSLAAQLTDQEVQTFITNLAQSDPELIIQSLFSGFIHQTNRSNDPQNDRCNDMISNIIQSRDDKSAKQDDIKFNTLPRRLVGRCASYLDHKSYSALSVCNRSAFLGCTTPIMVEELDLHYQSDSDYKQLDLSMFPFAKRLSINENESILSKKRMNRISSQIGKMRRLGSLDLEQVNWKFIKIITKNEETKRRTESLSVKVCDSAEYEKFMSSISGFKHLQFLKLCLAWIPEPAIDSDIKSVSEMCSHLKGLDVHPGEGGIGSSILQKVGHQLQYLRLHDADPELGNIDFANLLEFKEGYCTSDSMRAVLNTAVNLEKVQLKFRTDFIEEIMSKCQRLKYLEIDGYGKIGDHLDALERGLYQTKKQHRDTLKIRMHIDIETLCECIIKLDRVIKGLIANPVDHWMIILDVGRNLTKKRRSVVKDLRGNVNAETIVVRDGIDTYKSHLLLLTNTGCTISGWRESWLMNF